jgi:hypothetical protein
MARVLVGASVLVAAMAPMACGETTSADATDESAGRTSGSRSAATGDEQINWQLLTEEDAGPEIIETEYYLADIGLPEKKGTEIHLGGDNSSTLRWRFAQKPETFVMEWVKVDGVPAFETTGLIGDPATAAKVLEFHGNAAAETTIVLELVEIDPANRAGEPAKQLEYNFRVLPPGGKVYCFHCG